MTKTIGITGGIASGKSLISDWLVDQGYPLIDADIVSRQVLNKDPKLLNRIADTFGPAMINADGQLNRQKLGHLVFKNPAQRAKLNVIMQATIRREIEKQLQRLKNTSEPLVFLTVPLLYEEHYEDMCDAVIVVKVDTAAQLSRLRKRNNLDRQAALDRINSQMPLKEKIARADFVIDNNETKAQSIQQLKAVLAVVKA